MPAHQPPAKLTLQHWLAGDGELDDQRAVERADSLILIDQQVRRDRTTALFRDGAGEFAIVRRRGSPNLEGWWLPFDPYLPALTRISELAAGLLADVGELATPPSLHRVMYKPGQRAAYVVDGSDGQPGWLVKLLTPTAAAKVAWRSRLCADAGVGEVTRVPILVAHDAAAGVLLCSFIPGTPLSELPTEQITTDLRDRVIETVAAVHRLHSPTIPAWDVDKYLSAIGQLVDDASAALDTPNELHVMFDDVSRVLRRTTGESHLIHGDLTQRNIVVDDEMRIGLIDWDDAALGPVERDLATLATAFGGRTALAAVVATYEKSSDATVDSEVVDRYLDSQKLRKLCRKILAGNE
jgi:tRNA A-37 threonylcarbamoyl transferase component Bud32